MKNARIDVYKLFLLIIIFTTPYIVLAQENETKISSSENITKPLHNITVSESLSKSDNAKEDNTIKLLLLGWFLGVIQPFIIDPIKKRLDKRKFQKIVKKDIENITNILQSKKQSLLDFSRDGTLEDVIQRYTNPAEATPSMRSSPEISTDFYLKNYTKLIEYFHNNELLFKFYIRIQNLNSLGKTITELQDQRDNGYRLLFLAYLTHLREALREGESISI